MKTPPTPRPPADLQRAGRRFWRQTVDAYELQGRELALLVEACRTLDAIERLSEQVRQDGMSVRGSRGQPVLHPAIAEARMQRVVLGRLLGLLELPVDDAGDVGELGHYSPNSRKASKAAGARWRRAG